jgi:alpha-tubulin suppressor-like RCC1 family protein
MDRSMRSPSVGRGLARVSVLAPLFCACSTLGLEEVRFRCASPDDCVRGTVCDPVTATCVPPDEVRDAGLADACTSSCDAGTSVGVAALGVGGDHSCALMSDGTLRCWGSNLNGQLGDDQASGTMSPKPVPASIDGVQAIQLGLLHTCVLDTGGGVRCWGHNGRGQTGQPRTVTDVLLPPDMPVMSAVAEVGTGLFQSTCARTSSSAVFCWGYVLNGQGWGGLDGPVGLSDPTPRRVPGLSGPVSSFALGSYHGCARVGADVECWGNDASGELGDGTTTSTPTAVRLVLGGAPLETLSLGDHQSCGLRAGEVLCWGDVDQSGQPSAPGPVGLAGAAAAVGAGYVHACALLLAGSVECWGRSDVGQLGAIDTSAAVLPPTVVPGAESGVKALAVGWKHSCALMEGGEVRCWGDNAKGQLGTGDTEPVSRATKVSF